MTRTADDASGAGTDTTRTRTGADRSWLRVAAVQALRDKLVDLWRARELLRQFVSKELKVRYKNSALGFVWSLLTPALMTVVFTVVFSVVIRIPVDDFAAFFLSGYLVWMFFQNSAQASIMAIVGNGSLIKKVYFPREILPLSIVISQLVHFLLAMLAVSPFLVYARGWGVVTHLPVVVLGVVLVTMFTSGIAMLLAGANVTFRDLQELIVVMFMVWFYATPIIYPFVFVTQVEGGVARAAESVLSYNPMTWFVRLFRESIYGEVVANPACTTAGCEMPFLSTPQVWPSLQLVAATTVLAVLTFVVGYALFQGFAHTFAKEV